MQYPNRCGTCKHFPGNDFKCKDNSRVKMKVVYANDYGKGHCDNYEKGSSIHQSFYQLIIREDLIKTINLLFEEYYLDNCSIIKLETKYGMSRNNIYYILRNSFYATGELKWKGKTYHTITPALYTSLLVKLETVEKYRTTMKVK